ncbi:hypothetical protein BCR37DRAFT_155793 [Protomyces lactucae-debilis]|uniref:Uncharacterized protein n=1 Tax=Protomyces lactucae-debilis TaxID=2754530 RepID=A0A1Y2F1Y3_PROLT|nr:uncharacterized protein BCR37DRAFT_155793 [Protomyces lactucae-debilis]ORY76955.1 hypothetical protein BCR37DRAFT_155793 [Protomyces lactucae-debilis]
MLVAPEVVYVGFSRIAGTSHHADYQEKIKHSESQEIHVAVTVAIPDQPPFEFATPIHKQADLQTLARVIEANLAERNLVVACLIDQESSNVLRWADIVGDVLDSDSRVYVLPMTEETIEETLALGRRPSSPTNFIHSPTQMEFIQIRRPPSVMSASSSGRTAARNRVSLLQMHHERGGSSSPTLPASGDPTSSAYRLATLSSNAISLLAFLRFCRQKRTLLEVLFWLDTSIHYTEDYVERLYMSSNAPLKLNLPREVSGITEARQLLKDGLLAWSLDTFETSSENARVKQIQHARPHVYKKAELLFMGQSAEREQFLALLTQALDPEDTTILSLRERSEVATKAAILGQVCDQYFPGQIPTKQYFAPVPVQQLTRPERLRQAKRNALYGELLKTSPLLPSQTNEQARLEQIADEALSAARLADPVEDEVEVDADEETLEEVSTSGDRPENVKNTGDRAKKLSSLLGHDVVVNDPLSAQSSPISSSFSPIARTAPDQETLLGKLKRRKEVRSVSTRTVPLDFESSALDQTKVFRQPVSRKPSIVSLRPPSPTLSIGSRFSQTTTGSFLSRQESDADAARRSQQRRAAKLYAMFGENASGASVPHFQRRAMGPPDVRTSFDQRRERPRSNSRFSLLPDRSSSRASAYTPDRGEKRSGFMRSIFSHPNGSSTSIKSHTGSVESFGMALHPTRSRSGSVVSHMSRMPMASGLGDTGHISEDEDEDEDDEEGEAIVNDVRTNMKLRQLLGNDAPTSTMM